MPLSKQRAVANIRERERTQKLNQAYKQLQSIIPKEPSDKMSKRHTLKLALAYIDFLNELLKESDQPNETGARLEDGSLSKQLVKSPPPSASSFSPTGSSSNYYPHLSSSSTNSEEDEQEYQHRNKRMRTNPFQHDEKQAMHPTTCYTNRGNYTSSAQTTDYQAQGAFNANHYAPSTSSTINYSDAFSPQTQTSDEVTIDLRNAFRAYRSSKRKSTK